MTTRLTPAPITANPFTAWLALTGSELRRFSRNPMQAVFTLLFPVLFFALFALSNLDGKIAGVPAGPYMVVSYAAYGLMLTALSTFGTAVANERAMGWYKLLRVAPISAAQHLLAKFAMALVVGCLSVTVLMLFAVLVGHVALPLGLAVTILARLLGGMLAFLAMGAAFGFLLNPNAAVPIINILVLLMSFSSGLFVPLQFAPAFIRQIAPSLPSYHLAQLGWGSMGAQGTGAAGVHWLWLLGYGLVFLLISVWAYRRDESRNYS